jgi:hypothetical protein
VLAPSGAVLLIYLARLAGLGMSVARATVDLFLPTGEHARADSAVRDAIGGENRLAFGPVTIDKDLISLRFAEFSGELQFASHFPPVTLREPFLTCGSRELRWDVEIPDAEVTGDLRFAGGTLPIRGRGYRDRVWFDLLLWKFPIRELRWGRAVAGMHAATWVCAETMSGPISAGWLDGQRRDAPPPELELGQNRVLLESAVVDLEGLRLGPARPLLRRLVGDPRETKWLAPARIFGVSGQAIHEVVRWC